MWSDRKPWWQKKAKDNNEPDRSHYKDWCVIKIGMFENRIQNFHPVLVVRYKACLRTNAPQVWTTEGKMKKDIEVDNLTKHEAYCVAKGLNFLDGETNDK